MAIVISNMAEVWSTWAAVPSLHPQGRGGDGQLVEGQCCKEYPCEDFEHCCAFGSPWTGGLCSDPCL